VQDQTRAPETPPTTRNHSKVVRHEGGFAWRGIALEPYKETTETWRGVTRRELCGLRGESTRFHLRYFEIAPGGYSTLEQHDHEHVVIPIRGGGEVQFGRSIHRVGFGDVVYIAPGDPHQFRTPPDAGEPFGFLCIVDAERDAPVAVDGVGPCGICE
jgi:quercetin dioxygenase-like cupin family protein